jgi:phenylalanyl-tRNA synthetase beta chain
MDILISESWLRDFLKTKADGKKIAELLTLSGSSVEKTDSINDDKVFHIEVTTNRVDSACIYGIAREANAVLKRHGTSSLLEKYKTKTSLKTSLKVNYLDVSVDQKFCPRFSAVLIENVSLKESPDWMQKRLTATGIRPINNLVDITNYLMQETGQPTHVFDYDKILGHRMILRESLKGEKVTTLDDKTHKLQGGDIVIEDGKGRLIDLCGIMGGALSAVDTKTKNILLFVQKYNPVNIRRTSMSLSQRSQAAVLFEKDIDAENVLTVLKKGVEMYTTLANGKAKNVVLDIYKDKYKPKQIKVDLAFINKMAGVVFKKEVVSQILQSLEFSPKWQGNTLSVLVPSFRAKDINIKEDIVEEVVRVWGYNFIPDTPLEGKLPDKLLNPPFDFEIKVKNILKDMEGVEIYTSSLVSKDEIEGSALKIANPLGKEGEYLRTSLKPSLIRSALKNKDLVDSFFLFEMANVYLPQNHNLPEERTMLSGIFTAYQYAKAKGSVEYLLKALHVDYSFSEMDKKGYLPGSCLLIKAGKQTLGEMGLINNDVIYFELDVNVLSQNSSPYIPYQEIPKYPGQIEDITLVFPDRTKIGQVVDFIYKESVLIREVEFLGSYKDSFSFRIKYQDNQKTLTNDEVASLRTKLLKEIKMKFGGVEKS